MNELNNSKWLRLGLCTVLAAMALLLAGSIHPEKKTPVRDDAFAAANVAVRAMASEIPYSHRAEWEKTAARKPLLLFRCGQE